MGSIYSDTSLYDAMKLIENGYSNHMKLFSFFWTFEYIKQNAGRFQVMDLTLTPPEAITTQVLNMILSLVKPLNGGEFLT